MKKFLSVLALIAALAVSNAHALLIGVGEGPFGGNASTIAGWLNNQGHTATIIDPSVAANFSERSRSQTVSSTDPSMGRMPLVASCAL